MGPHRAAVTGGDRHRAAVTGGPAPWPRGASSSGGRHGAARDFASKRSGASPSGCRKREGSGAPAARIVLGLGRDVQADLDRFLTLVLRELSAREAHLLEGPEGPAVDESLQLRCALPDGRALVALFDAPPEDREPKQRRLEMLASTFVGTVEGAASRSISGDAVETPASKRPSRPPAARSLRDELKALCVRAGAVNALVIDANSPVVWGAARTRGLGDEWPVVGGEVEEPDEPVEHRVADVDVASRAALEIVRSLEDLATLRRGKHIRHVEREGKGPHIAHSFAGIYLLVLAYAAPFDELRAERAIAESLPRIEQLVLALPPLDPSPSAGAGVLKMRRPRPR